MITSEDRKNKVFVSYNSDWSGEAMVQWQQGTGGGAVAVNAERLAMGCLLHIDLTNEDAVAVAAIPLPILLRATAMAAVARFKGYLATKIDELADLDA